jgi:hypothetical protein
METRTAGGAIHRPFSCTVAAVGLACKVEGGLQTALPPVGLKADRYINWWTAA